jgi:hypothetical protein
MAQIILRRPRACPDRSGLRTWRRFGLPGSSAPAGGNFAGYMQFGQPIGPQGSPASHAATRQDGAATIPPPMIVVQSTRISREMHHDHEPDRVCGGLAA